MERCYVNITIWGKLEKTFAGKYFVLLLFNNYLIVLPIRYCMHSLPSMLFFVS